MELKICKTRLSEEGDKAKDCYEHPHLFCDFKIAELKAKYNNKKYFKKYKSAKLF